MCRRLVDASPVRIDLLVALSTAPLLWAAIAPIGQFYLEWVGLVPLLWRLHSIYRTRRAAAIGFVSGLAFFALGFHWLFYATWPGYLVVCVIMGLYWMLAAIIIHRVRGFGALWSIPVAAATWAGTEYLRGTVLGGFPWLNLGETQAPTMLLLCQIADVTGAAGVTAWVVLPNATLLRLADESIVSEAAIVRRATACGVEAHFESTDE